VYFKEDDTTLIYNQEDIRGNVEKGGMSKVLYDNVEYAVKVIDIGKWQ
jgi:hypothetical protein